MPETRRTIVTPDGPMHAHLVAPPGGAAPLPAVVVVQEAFGVNGHIRDVCQRLAAGGYVALAPEVYHREGDDLEVSYAEGPRAMELLATLTNEGLTTDLAAAFAALRADPRVDPARVGLLGFCAGGFAAFLGACRLDPAATVAMYAGGVVRQRPTLALRPLREEFGAIRAPLLGLFGGADAGIPMADVEAIREGLARVGPEHEVVVYEGARHAFFNDLRPAQYAATAAQAAWERTRGWFARHLAAGAAAGRSEA